MHAPDAVEKMPVGHWLQLTRSDDPMVFHHRFAEHHIGNPWIRSIHGGVTAGIAELAAEAAVLSADETVSRCEMVTSSVNYLRTTHDSDTTIRVSIIRITKRLAFVDTVCWQDDETKPVVQANCTLRLFRDVD